MVCAPQQQRKICLVNHKIIFPEIQAEFIAKQRVLAGHFQWGKSPDRNIVEARTEHKCRASLSQSHLICSARCNIPGTPRLALLAPRLMGVVSWPLRYREIRDCYVMAHDIRVWAKGRRPFSVCLTCFSAKLAQMYSSTATLRATTPSQLDRVTTLQRY